MTRIHKPSESLQVPLRAVAAAAHESATRLRASTADVFDIEKPSRARLVAFAALARAYPSARQVEIAALLGGWTIGRTALQRESQHEPRGTRADDGDAQRQRRRGLSCGRVAAHDWSLKWI